MVFVLVCLRGDEPSTLVAMPESTDIAATDLTEPVGLTATVLAGLPFEPDCRLLAFLAFLLLPIVNC